jgi:murein DD-endopeptidase MepM/ murein hydrolase activator NlpD
MMERPNQSRRGRVRLAASLACASVLAIAAGAIVATAPAKDLQQRLDQTQSKLNRTTAREGVLTTEITHAGRQLDRLQVEVADLRNREAAVAAELAQKQAELAQAQATLEALRARLRRAIQILEDRLIALYKSSEPDLITVLLSSHGFDDLLERAEYMQRLDEQDNAIVTRVRDLRNQTQETVDTVKAARNVIAARKQTLERTRAKLERRTAELAAARKRQKKTLDRVRAQKKDLEGDLSEISEKIAEQLGVFNGTLPAGAIRPGAAGFIWPVNGPIVSGFGPRWGSFHEGVDIAVPTGTPIRAAKSGNIVLAGATGGYGNYTCIDHGGGLSTCYAHQSRFARTSGAISQGSILGFVGCTGHCFGPHLHFEVRINGQAVDPLGYL